MDLTTLSFRVQTEDLDVAAKKIGVLADAVSHLNKVNDESVKVSKDAVDAAISLETAQTKLGKSAKTTGENLSKTKSEIDPLEKLLNKLNNQYGDLVAGFTKGEAAILQQARAAGASADQLKPFADILARIKELTKDPFDASVGSLRSVTQEFERMAQRADLAGKGISLSAKQLGEYSRIAAEVRGKVTQMNLDPTQGEGLELYNRLLKENQAEYLRLAAAVNSATHEEKLRNQNLKETERLTKTLESGKSKVFWDNYTQSLTGTSREMQQLNSYFKEMERESKRNTSTVNETAKATAWLERELARAENAARGFNEELKISTSNRLFKFEEQLKKAGITGQEATRMMNSYRANILKGQEETNAQMDKQLRNMSRAVAVQMGDVGVSLASGMNPLLVAIQQGDQLRAAFAQVDASADQVRKSMTTAATMIAQSFIDTGKAVGYFFAGAITAAGKQALAVLSAVPMSLYAAFEAARKGAESSGKPLTVFFDTLKASLSSSLPTLIGVTVAALGTLAVAFYKVAKEQDEFNKQLILNGASMGLNAKSAMEFARGLNNLNISTSKAVGLMTDLAKEGGFLNSELSTIIPVGLRLVEVFGMTTEEVSKLFSKIKKDPVDALYDLAKSMGTVNLEVIRFVEDQMKVGNVLGANEAAMKEFARVHNQAASEMERDYSNLGLAIKATKKFFGDLWSGVKDLVYTPIASEKMKSEMDDLNDEITRVKGNLDTLAKLGVKGDDSLLRQLQARSEALREMLTLQQRQEDVQARSKASNATAAAAMEKLAEMSKSTEAPYAKMIRTINELNTLRDQSNGDAKAEEQYLAAATKAIKDYQEAIDRQNKVKKEANPTLDAYNRYVKESNKLNNKGVAAQEDLTEAERKYLDLKQDPEYKNFSNVQKEDLRIRYQLAEESERLGKLDDQLARGRSAVAKEEQANREKQLDAIRNLLASSKQMTDALFDETAMLQAKLGLIGETDSKSKLALATLAAELKYKKEIRDIEESGADPEFTSTKLLKDEALERFKRAIKNANTEVAIDLASKLSQSLDGDNSFSKSAARFSDALKQAGNTSFANVIDSLSRVSSLFEDIALQQENFAKRREKAKDNEQDLAKVIAQQKKAEIKSYGDLVSAAKGFFKEGSSGYKTMMNLEKAFRAYELAMAIKNAAVKIAQNASVVGAFIAGESARAAASIAGSAAATSATMVEGTAKAATAVATQGTGDPYTAFARIAAMAAIMTGLGFAVKGGKGGSPGVAKNEGRGTVFGDSNATSKSIVNGLQILNEVNTLTMKYSSQMLQSLRSIDSKIGGLTNLVLRSGNETFAMQESSVNFGKTGTIPNVVKAVLGGGVGLLAGKLIDNLFNKKVTLQGQGIFAGDANLASIMQGGLQAGYFSEVRTKKKAFGITYSDKTSTINTVDSELSQQFSAIIQNFVETVRMAAGPLGTSLDEIDQNLSNFVLKIGYIDTKDLTGEQIQEKLNAVFGAAGDNIAKAALPGLEKFQKVGEGYFETVVRLANSFETFTSWVDTLGFSLSSVNLDSAMNLIDMIGGVSELSSAFSSFYDNFYSESEKTANITRQLTSAFSSLGISMPKDKLEYRALLEKSIAEGNTNLTVTLLNLSDAFAKITPEITSSGSVISDTLKDLQKEYASLNIELLQVQGKTTEADAAIRALATQGMSAIEIASWDANRALEAQIQKIKDANAAAEEQARLAEQVAQQRIGLETQLLQLQGNTAALRERELAALDPSNRAIQVLIWSLQDQATAANEAARAQQELAAKQLQISQENYSLETRLLQLQGNTATLRERELAALDPSNRELLKQIFALEDKIKADEEAAKVAEEAAKAQAEAAEAAAKAQAEAAEAAAKAAEEIREAWQDITDSLIDEVKRIRNLASGGGALTYAQSQRDFNSTVSKAIAGDQTAAKLLPDLSKSMLDLAETQSSSLYELRKIQLMTSVTLENIAKKYATAYGLQIPAYANGGNYQGGLALVGEQGPELINFNNSGRVYDASTTKDILGNTSLVELLEKLNSNIEMLRYEVRAVVTHTSKTAKVLDRVTPDGRTISVSFLEPQEVTNV